MQRVARAAQVVHDPVRLLGERLDAGRQQPVDPEAHPFLACIRSPSIEARVVQALSSEGFGRRL
jgi:hypothetical protein